MDFQDYHEFLFYYLKKITAAPFYAVGLPISSHCALTVLRYTMVYIQVHCNQCSRVNILVV